MSLGYSGFGDTRRRRRRRLYSRLARVLFAVLVVMGVGGYGYQVGVSANQARIQKLEADLTRFQQNNLDLRDQLALNTQRSDEVDRALEELRQRYSENVPKGELATLVDRVQAQLQAGVDPARLAFLIEAAASPPSCDGEPVTKRFMPRTPISTGPISFVRFGDRITVTGTGQSARNPEGLAEAWYDPTYPVHLEFRTPDGAVTSVEGVLPLNHGMVVDGREYRFTIVAGDQWFVNVTGQSCSFPKDAGPAGANSAGSRGDSLG
jgi:cell division protein FtsB